MCKYDANPDQLKLVCCVYVNRAGLNYKHTNIVASLQDFLSAIFDTLLYQLNDALSRLGKVKRYETDKEG